jgi:hypothetical protein
VGNETDVLLIEQYAFLPGEEKWDGHEERERRDAAPDKTSDAWQARTKERKKRSLEVLSATN